MTDKQQQILKQIYILKNEIKLQNDYYNETWCNDDDAEEIYNSTELMTGMTTAGVFRQFLDNPGMFYQTYGNGGGPGGWGGYWKLFDCDDVWEVEGNIFTYLDNKTIKICGRYCKIIDK